MLRLLAHSRSQRHLRNGATAAVTAIITLNLNMRCTLCLASAQRGPQFALLFGCKSQGARSVRRSEFIPLIIPIYFNSRHNQIRGEIARRKGRCQNITSHVGAKSPARRATYSRKLTPARTASFRREPVSEISRDCPKFRRSARVIVASSRPPTRTRRIGGTRTSGLNYARFARDVSPSRIRCVRNKILARDDRRER